jgi:hypothetical protein
MTTMRSSTPGTRPYGMLPIIGLFFAALVVLNLLITGLSDPPSIVPPVTLDENTGVPPVPTNADFPYDRTHSLWAIVLLGGVGAARGHREARLDAAVPEPRHRRDRHP